MSSPSNLSTTHPKITVIGAGMAGSEAALAAAALGVEVELFEMRPHKMTPAHHTDKFAELVCSNSLGGRGKGNAKGLLQAEMLHAKALIVSTAYAHRVPAGGALAVDREAFSQAVTTTLESHPRITIKREEITDIPAGVVVLASGPLTSDHLAATIQQTVGESFLGFYDAAAPVIAFDSIDMSVAYKRGRYEQDADYINIPFTREQYDSWYEAVTQARQHTPHDWEKLPFFEACMPIEELARRGYDTPRFGPMKPVGLNHPETNERYFAVAQMRQEDIRGQMWSLVGFQTGLKWGDQKALVKLMPGLAEAEIVRYGVMHRNTYLNAPKLLSPYLHLREQPQLFVAGVLAGTEGYLESSATGWLAGTNAARAALGALPVVPPELSMLGGLTRYLATATKENFQPMNAAWSLVPSIPKQKHVSKLKRREIMFERGLTAFEQWLAEIA